MTQKAFRFKPETLKRCKTVELTPKTQGQFTTISLEMFHFLYHVKGIDFAIYFRAGDTVLEFIKPEELSKELLDDVWQTMQKPIDGLSVCVLKKDRPRFERAIATIRQQRLTDLAKRQPNLDQKTLDLYGNLSSASQMIVTGGIDREVAETVKASAAYLVSNIMDSDTAIDTLSRMITCDPTLYDHSASVAMFASVIATKLVAKPLPSNMLQAIAQCALYHDVGKTCVPSTILNKPGRFTPAEFEIMKTHTTLGSAELQRAREQGAAIDETAVRVALEHHEKFCGGGYPHGRKGRFEDDPENGIHFCTRIVTIADIYSALLMKRVYKEAFEPQDAIKIMAESAKDLDPELFPAFLKGVVKSLNAQQNSPHGKGRILQIDESGSLREIKKPA